MATRNSRRSSNRSSNRPSSRKSSKQRGSSSKRKASRLFHRGDDAINRVDYELEQQKAKREAAAKNSNKPLRFFVPVGETKEIVILDDKPDFFMYEHSIKNPQTGRWDTQLPCIKECDNCPVCEQVGDSTYIMFLSVLDLSGFEDRNGNWHDFSRKLMAVKPTQQKKFIRRYQKEGTLRGAIFECSRDGKKDAAIGNDIEFIEFMDEEELSNDYINEWTDRENKHHTENQGQPIEYEEIFEEPTQAELRAIVGGEATPGSRDQVEKDLDDDDDGWDDTDSDDDTPWEEDEEDKSTKRSRSRSGRSGRSKSRRSKKEEEPEDDIDEDDEDYLGDDDEEEEKQPHRGRRGSSSKKRERPSSRRSSGSRRRR